MNEFPICPLCGQPVNTNAEAHITEADGTVKHHECPAPEPEHAAE
jgi:hypothetical protein